MADHSYYAFDVHFLRAVLSLSQYTPLHVFFSLNYATSYENEKPAHRVKVRGEE